MSVDEGLSDWLSEALGPLGTLTRRAMMGGATFYLDGIVFAIAGDGRLWLKADLDSDAEWNAAGAEKFSVTFANGRTGVMNYRRAPDEVYDDSDVLRRWAALALEAGRRAAARKRPKRNKASS